MARQLLENRSPAAYAGVQQYALRHKDDAGALAWLVLGYAHLLDKDYPAAIGPLTKARAHPGELGDYADYYLGSAQAKAGDNAGAIATLRGFDEKYPDSLLHEDAAAVEGGARLASGETREAIRVVEAHRNPRRADLELLLGRAYAAAGEPAKAVQVLRKLYFQMPLSAEASDAGAELRGLSALAGIPPATFAEQKVRAELMAQGRRYADAAEQYRDLLPQAPADDVPGIRVALASALWHAGRSREAREMLESTPATPDEVGAQRAYLLVEITRPDEQRVEQLLASMRATTPQSRWLENALRSSANMYLLKPDADKAAGLYLEGAQRFPSGKYAPSSHWRAAWLNFRQGKSEEAKSLFEAQVRNYANSAEVVPALYWRARLAENDHDYGKARAWYLKIVNRYRQYYYADLAQQRLKTIPPDPPATDDPLLARIPPATSPGLSGQSTDIPPDNLRAQKSLLLENGALYEQAVRELQAAAADGGSGWALAQIAHLYQQDGHYDRALQALKRAVPGYFGLNLEELPRPLWEALFPRAYWDDMKRYAESNQLDPFLVAALVRQESEFNPEAISHANAIGLMQLLPSTGKRMAREVHLRGYSLGQLAAPSTNLQLGTRYFHELLDKFGGNVEYALAAYNAGADRVEDWKAAGNFRDNQEFVESIPFTETREYVQAILRNARVYRRLYGDPVAVAEKTK